MKASYYITSLFIGGIYYWLIGEETSADIFWKAAVEIHEMNLPMVGEA